MKERNISKTRIISFALAVLLLAGVLIPNSPISPITEKQAQVHQYLSPYDSDAVALKIQDAIYYGILEHRESIDISNFPVTVAEFGKIWTDLRYEAPDLYMVKGPYRYSYKTINGIRYVTKFWPNYTMTAEEMAEAQLVWVNELQEILSTRNPNWSAMQTLVYFHDYLVVKCQYDNSYTYYDAYNMLIKDTGVCMAYTLLYQALMDALGYNTDYVVSEEMNHIWNRVRLGSSIYNIDVTWDDPNPNRLGQVDHYHLLTSDRVMSENHQYTWEEGNGMCTDPLYDDAFWRDVHTALIPVGDEFFFIYKGSIYCWTADNKLEKRVSLSSKWYTDSKKNRWWRYQNEDGSYCVNYSVMQSAGDKIMYSAAYSIKTFNPANNKLETLYNYKGKGCIYGFTYHGDSITLQVSNHPNGPFEYITVTDFKKP